jgi:beta-1,4-mannosyl-glycoprotein beta-1,4-N-acetylglucosaminyltransferase
MPRIFDCFPFFNELDLLEIRLNELCDVVDYFVLVEAPFTHSGNKKPLYFAENKKQFGKFWNKIMYYNVPNMPITKKELSASMSVQDLMWLESGYQREDSWIRERFQRNAIMDRLQFKSVYPTVEPDDIVIIEDADEMVRPEVLCTINDTMSEGVNAVGQTLHTYFLNWRCNNMPWWGSKIVRFKDITTPSEDRFHTPARKYYYDGGWHFGYLGGVEAIKLKLQSFAHIEFDTPETFARIPDLLSQRKDALGRQYQYDIVPIDETYPKYLRDNLDKFKHLIYDNNSI